MLKKVVILYAICSISRMFLSFLYVGPGVMIDELVYKTSAQSFFMFGDFYKLNDRGADTNIGNILYQLLIFPSFYFGSYSYTVAKAINSFLITSAIFPTFLLSRFFSDEKRSILVAALVILLPANLYANYIMVESLFFPLFMFAFYFVYKSLIKSGFSGAVAGGVCIALLFLTKPNALILVVAMGFVVAILIVFARHFSISKLQLVQSFGLTIGSMIISYIVIVLLIKHRLNPSEILGRYGGVGWDLMTNSRRATAYSEASLRMVIGHLTGFLFFYGIPALVALAALLRSFKEKDYRNFIFLVWGSTLFLAFLAMTVKFTLDLEASEHLMRLHGRYYFFTYPFFLITFTAFLNRLERSWLIIAAFIVTGVLVSVSVMTVFSRFSHANMLVDFPDWVWLIAPHSGRAFTGLEAAFLLLCFYYAFSKIKRHYPYILFFLLLCIAGNVGAVYVQVGHAKNQWLAIKGSLELIESTITDRRDPVTLIGDWSPGRMQLNFWLPYENLYVRILPPEYIVSDAMIPKGTKWLIDLRNVTLRIAGPMRLIGSDDLIRIFNLEETSAMLSPTL